MKKLDSKLLVAIGLLGLGTAAFAQSQITIQTTVNAPGLTPPIWVALSGFSGEAEQVLRFDLYVQGFNFTNADNAQYLISGSNSGNLQGRVIDRYSKRALVAKAYTGATLRRQAHAFADDFVEALGRKGISQTKIAFVHQARGGGEIYVSDFDGFDPRPVTADHTIVAAPAWAPGRLALYYTSYKLGNPDLFFHDLTTGRRDVFARYPGLNTSAAVSPDGHRVAMILSKGGSPDVYVADANGSHLLRLTATRADESSPCWSPDGRWICYASKIREHRVLEKIPAQGGTPEVVRTIGGLNPTEPVWSPDGKWIAFTAQMGRFEICVVPSSGGVATVLADGEDPSWSANSRTLVFAHRTPGYEHVLSLLDVPTKQVKDVARIPGSNSQPCWAK